MLVLYIPPQKFFPKKHSLQNTQNVKHGFPANSSTDFKIKGKIGIRMPRDPIMKAADIEGVVLITIPFTPEEAKTVTEYLNRSSVPLSMPNALAVLRLYFLGMVDEGHTRFMIG